MSHDHPALVNFLSTWGLVCWYGGVGLVLLALKAVTRDEPKAPREPLDPETEAWLAGQW